MRLNESFGIFIPSKRGTVSPGREKMKSYPSNYLALVTIGGEVIKTVEIFENDCFADINRKCDFLARFLMQDDCPFHPDDCWINRIENNVCVNQYEI